VFVGFALCFRLCSSVTEVSSFDFLGGDIAVLGSLGGRLYSVTSSR